MESMDSLLMEMLQRFPEVPCDTVKAHVKLVRSSSRNDAQFCLKLKTKKVED